MGKAVYSSGKIYECQEIFLDVRTTKDQFQLNDGGYRCGDLLHASFDPFKFIIKDGKLTHHDEVMGTITDSELKYEAHDPDDGSTYRLKLIQVNTDIEYFEEWFDGEKIALTVKGKLSPNGR